METFKKIWVWVVGAFGIILSLFFMERSKRKEVEAKLENAEFSKTDAVLQNQQQDKQQEIIKSNEEVQALKEQHDKDLKNTKELTPSEVETYWKNRGSK